MLHSCLVWMNWCERLWIASGIFWVCERVWVLWHNVSMGMYEDAIGSILHVYLSVWMFDWRYICVGTGPCVCAYKCAYVYDYVYAYKYDSICVLKWVCTWVSVSRSLSECLCVCIWVLFTFVSVCACMLLQMQSWACAEGSLCSMTKNWALDIQWKKSNRYSLRKESTPSTEVG